MYGSFWRLHRGLMSWHLNRVGARTAGSASAPTPGVAVATAGADPTELSRLRHLDADRRRFLHQVVAGESFEIILRGIAQMLENQFPGSRVATLLGGEGFFFASRPDDNDQCLMEAASAATAAAAADQVRGDRSAALREPIGLADLATDPAWANVRPICENLGFQSCWTIWIPTPQGAPHGALCLLMPKKARPTEAETELVRSAAAQAGITVEHHQLGKRLMHQGLHDAITGLPNRILLQDRLTQALNLAERNNEQVGLFLLDVDGFKFINDTLGQADGDALLREIAQRLLSSVRRSDTVARLNGDEFLFVAGSLDDRRGAAAVAEKLLSMLSTPFLVNGRELVLTASIGVSLYPIDGTDAATLQRNADAALARAKSQGRGGMTFFAPEMNAAALERLELEGQLRRAIDAGELRLHYRPQVDSRGRWIAVEALVRWQHPRLGLIPPGRFIPIAEQSGLILPLGDWVLREACRQLQAWTDRPELADIRIAVNVSAMQFAQPQFVQWVKGILGEAGLDPRRLELELTESLLMKNTAEEAEKVESLRRIGVKLAIDDFGTGYASLSYLHRLPIDTLKIDRTFVEAIDTVSETEDGDVGTEASDAETSSRTAVIRAILSMGRSLGINVLAEGVETPRQRDFLIRHGCEMMQGYFFGRPAPVQDIEAKLGAKLAMSA